MTHAIKLAGESDLTSILALMKEFYAGEHLAYNKEILIRGLRQLFADPKFGSAFLIETDGMTIGYIVLTFGFSLEFHGVDCLVDEFYVQESHRGMGIGASVLDFVTGFCRERGVAAVHLEVDRENMRAQQLYHRKGFNDHNRYLLTKWV